MNKPGTRPPAPCPAPSDENDPALFHAAVADATPLKNRRVHHPPPKPPAIPRQRQQDEEAALHEAFHAPALPDLYLEGGDEAAFARPGIARAVLRDLRRGRWVSRAALDLHGLTRAAARAQTGVFLAECVALGHRCVRIIHGKGLSSPQGEPVLKKLLPGWLAKRQEVLAFCQARAAEGGSGALVVLLKGGAG